jgi:hypothetical protein
MDRDKIEQFYAHPRKHESDFASIRNAWHRRRLATDPSLRWRLHRRRLNLEERLRGAWRSLRRITPADTAADLSGSKTPSSA